MTHTIRSAWHATLWTVAPLVGMVGVLGLVRSAHAVAAYGPVYTVTALRAHLAQDPHGWVGRPLWVQSLVISSVRLHGPDVGSIVVEQPQLLDPAAPDATLPLVEARAAPLWAWLRHLPLLGGLLPAPQCVYWQTLARYRIMLRESASGGTAGRDEAVLLDGA